MSITKLFVAFLLAPSTITILHSESRCPGNVESLPYHSLNHHQIVVPVSINHSGPYNFLLDTGTQRTIIDPALAGDLHLAAAGQASVASAGMNAAATVAMIDTLELGSHHVTILKVLIFDIGMLQGRGQEIRGVLGEDFLQQFDLLIDNAHKMICLDDSRKMRAEIKGGHIELLELPSIGSDGLPRPPVVAVRLPDGLRPLNLELDSGADVSFLYSASAHTALGPFGQTSQLASGAAGDRRTFTQLPSQDIRIGPVAISKVSFLTLLDTKKDPHTAAYDGMLSVGLFKRVLIAHADHFAVLETW